MADMNEYDDDMDSPEPQLQTRTQRASSPPEGMRRPGELGGSGAGSRGGQRPGGSAVAPGLDGNDVPAPGGPVQDYRPEDYAHLNDRVSPAVRELFAQIGRYKPQTVTLDTILRPFIPEYIPALGEIDEFVKVPRPDGKPDYLGMKVLDEPSLRQSDRALLTLQLKNLARGPIAAMEVVQVEAVDDVDQAALTKRLTTWINSVEDLHRSKPPQEVTYSKNMPDLDTLMQEWPEEVEHVRAQGEEEAAIMRGGVVLSCVFIVTLHISSLVPPAQVIREHKGILPGAHTPMPASQMARALCALLDVPVHFNLVESLHLMFALYLEMRNINPGIAQGTATASGGFPGNSPLSLSQSGPMK